MIKHLKERKMVRFCDLETCICGAVDTFGGFDACGGFVQLLY